MNHAMQRVTSPDDIHYYDDIGILLPQKGDNWLVPNSEHWLQARTHANGNPSIAPTGALYTLRHYPLEVLLQFIDDADRDLIIEEYLSRCSAQDLQGKSLSDIIVTDEAFDRASVDASSVKDLDKGGRVGSIIGGGLIIGGVLALIAYLNNQDFIERLKNYFHSAMSTYMLSPVSDPNRRSHWLKTFGTGHCMAVQTTGELASGDKVDLEYEGHRFTVEAPVFLSFTPARSETFHLESAYADVTPGGVFTGLINQGRCWNDVQDRLDIGGNKSDTEWNRYQIYSKKS